MEELYRLFGQSLKRFRQEAGLTQEQLANRVGLSRTSITNIERGKQHVLVHVVYELATAVNKQPEELLPPPETLSQQSVKARKLEEIGMDETNRELLKKMMEHSDKIRGGGKT